MKSKKKSVKIIFIMVTILILTLNRGFRNLVIRTVDLMKLKKEVVEIEKQNTKLKNEIYLLENDMSYVECCIRKEFGYLKPGEIEYRFSK